MNAERQPVSCRSGINRPKRAASERCFLHGQHEDLHEAGVLGAAFDLVDRILGILQGHDDRAAQARIAIETLPREPGGERARAARCRPAVPRRTPSWGSQSLSARVKAAAMSSLNGRLTP